jgi:hypothetical protein
MIVAVRFVNRSVEVMDIGSRLAKERLLVFVL